MDSSYSDSRPMFVQSPWNQTQTNDSIMPYPMNNEQSESQPPSSKRPRLNDDTVFNPTTTSNNSSWMAPPPSLNTPPVNNRGTAKIFYKTRMCAKFKAGTCMNGDPCNFAHGVEDLRQPPSNWQEIVGPPPPSLVGDRGRERERPSSSSVSASNNWEDDQKIILRMKLCRKFCFGEECPYGDRCNFIHEDLSKFREENGKLMRESLAISVVDPMSVENGSHQVEVVNRQGGIPVPAAPLNNGGGGIKTVYWKTRLCGKFEKGQCPFGDNCHFAHGQAELLQHSVGSVEGMNAVAAASVGKQMVVPANEAFAMKPTAQVTTADSSGLNDEGRRKKCLLKWSDSKKINRIYGDWIDDLPVGQKSTKPVES